MANLNRVTQGRFSKMYMNGQILIELKLIVVCEHLVKEANHFSIQKSFGHNRF